MNRYLLLVFFWSVISKSLLIASINKNISFNHFGQNEGLSNSTVFAISQDGEGDIWFATYDGINRFNGYEFTVYRHTFGDSTSIASDISRCIVVDKDDRLWVGTREGLSLYNKYTDKFSNYYYKKNGVNVSIVGIASIDKNMLMLGTEDGIILFDTKYKRFLNDTLPSSVHKLCPTTISAYGNRIFIGSRNGVFAYTPSTCKLVKLFDSPVGVGIHSILCQRTDLIWVGTEGDGLYLYDEKKRKLRVYKKTGDNRGPISNYVRSLMFDKGNNLWIGTYDGLNIYNELEDRFLSIQHSEVSENGLSSNSVRCVFCDSQGGMWLGTYWSGIDYYHPLCNRFKLMKHSSYVNSISDNVVSCIIEDESRNLWIGTNDGGLNFYDNSTSKFKKYDFHTSVSSVPFKDVKTVYVDEKSNLVYVGAHASGIMVLNSRTGVTEYYNKENNKLPSNNIYSIISDGANGLLIASLEYLLYYDKKTSMFRVIDHDADGAKLLSGIRKLFIDSKKRLWIGGERGVSVYTVQCDTLKKYSGFSPNDELRRSSVNCFHEDASGTMWIGSRNGLFAISGNGEVIKVYTTEHGLPNNVILGILEDVYGRLWISTNNGLSCFDTVNEKFRNFNSVDGLQGNQFCAGAFCHRANGDMLFGGINGISIFRPDMLIDNPYSPNPIINHFFVFNKEVLPGDDTGILEQHISYTNNITLTSSQNSFALSFVVSNYIAGCHNTFAYKLDGYDNEWYVQNDMRQVCYANLPAGDYTFMVKAANNDGKWNEKPTVLHIRILQVWYRTWWALSLFVILFALLILAIERFFWLRKSMKAELRMERLDKERMEEISQMKIRFYINVSHELRTPLTLIVAPLQELLSRVKGHWEREQLTYIQSNTNRLLHLVNQQMDYRRAELDVFKLHPSYSNAYKRMLKIFLNYENLAKRKNIEYNFITELQDTDELFDNNYLDLIVNNLLSNAFKYTPEFRKITLKLYKQQTKLVIEVADTGIGIAPERQNKIFERFYQADGEHEGCGIGLSLVKRLVDLHHGNIELHSELEKGSVFRIFLPQNPDAYTTSEFQDSMRSEADDCGYSTNVNDVYIGDDLNYEYDENSNDNNASLRGTILVVEDNSELRRFIVNGLSSLFNVLEAENGQIALDILKEEDVDVDLIITDIMMPVVDGVKLCKQVKQNLRTCHIPVYMLSAKIDVKSQLEGLYVGADDYISKPFSMEVLKTKILNVMRTRYRVFERYSHSIEVVPEKITNNALDEELLHKAIKVVEDNMDNVEFSTEQFAHEMNMSRSNLHIKLKAITGKSAKDFIHKVRFNRACQLLKDGRYTVSEVCFMVGYNAPSYFASRFKKYVGCLPTEYGKNKM